jgi:polyvinyl alcohol dehydrogenase (cytochrome)
MLISRFLPATFAVAVCVSAYAAPPDGEALYKARCASCHDGKPQPRMPERAELTAKSPEFVFSALSSGAMMVQAAGLDEADGRAIARYITGKEFSAVSSAPMAGQCTTPAPSLKIADGDWSGWGSDPTNSHFQKKPGLDAGDVPKLKLKWAFAFPNDPMAFSQPAVVGGRLFVGSAGGDVYSLNASTGCIYWTYKAGASVRTAISVAKLPNGKWAAYFGDVKATAHAVDAETGTLLWKIKLDEHPAARITGAPILVNGRLYVPMSSVEEAFAQQPKYACCTFRGSVSALDAATGTKIWQSYSVTDPAKSTGKTSKNGTELKGPAGAAIWSSPTVDLKRKLVYVASGNSYTSVEINTSDSILAFNLDTGRLTWSSQVQPKDNFVIGCPRGPQCDPDDDGPDFDFGTSPILRKLPNGKDILVVGQKAGVAWGIDPDNRGKVIWQTRLGKGSALGGIEWGPAADDKLAYVAVADRIVKDGTPGLYALDLATGQQKWGTPAPKGIPGNPAQSAAVAVIPGVVFSGALNGHFRAYSTSNGEIIWDFDTNRPFDTVNQVEKAKGGSIDAPGPVIAHGMVYTNSGYGLFGGIAGNVLLAFSVDGK